MLIVCCGGGQNEAFVLKERIGIPLGEVPFEIKNVEVEPIIKNGVNGEWDSVDVLNPSVIQWKGQYFNYYSGFDGNTWRTGLAISEDGYHWEKYENNPVFGIEDLNSEHTDYIAANGSAIVFGGKVYYFYHAVNTQGIPEIGVAVSDNGFVFEDNGIIITMGEERTWESRGCADPYAIVYNDKIYLYYLGMNEAGVQRLGVAESKDGFEWVRSAANPILDVGTRGAFDENGLGEPSVYYSMPYFYMLYTGRNSEEERNIGLAVSYNGIDWKKMSYYGEFTDNVNWNSKVICDTTFIDVKNKTLVYYGGGDKAEPAENLNGQIGVFEVALDQNRDMKNWNANADWSIARVKSEDVLAGSHGIEGDDNAKSSWCGSTVELDLKNDFEKSEIYISGWIPVDSIHGMAGVDEVILKVYVNSELVLEQSFFEDSVFEFCIPKKENENEKISVCIKADSEIVPAQYSDSVDERKLSYTLTCIEQR